nr:MAG TPA: hypothetical protein [Caudoviricetes sp.]
MYLTQINHPTQLLISCDLQLFRFCIITSQFPLETLRRMK